jgi:hypothetical protein
MRRLTWQRSSAPVAGKPNPTRPGAQGQPAVGACQRPSVGAWVTLRLASASVVPCSMMCSSYLRAGERDPGIAALRQALATYQKSGRLTPVSEPGSVHDITAACIHALPTLYRATATGLPVLADPGYDGAGIGIHIPSSSPQTGGNSISALAPATPSSALCAAWANADSRCSPAAGAPCSTSLPAPATSATSPVPRSSSPIPSAATSDENAEITSLAQIRGLNRHMRPVPYGTGSSALI